MDLDNGYVYIGGSFSHVNGMESQGVAALNVAAQAWEPRSTARVLSLVHALALSRDGLGTLYAGGQSDIRAGQG